MNRTARDVREVQGTARKPLAVFLVCLLAFWVCGVRAQSCPSGQSPRYVAVGGGCTLYACASSCFSENKATWGQLVQAFEDCAPQGALTEYNTSTYWAKFASSFLPGPAAPSFDGPTVTLTKIGTRYRKSDNLEFGSSQSYGLAVFQARYICAGEPDPEPECPDAGTAAGSAQSGSGVSSICEDGCTVKRVEGATVGVCLSPSYPCWDNPTATSYVGGWEYTGESCTTPTETRESGAQCVMESGLEVCTNVDPTDSSCITIEGRKSCYSDAGGVCSTPECFAAANNILNQSDGSRITPDSAGAPPKPDNGTPGTPAGPDMEYRTSRGNTDGSGNHSASGTGGGTYHYFTPGAVQGSSDYEPGEEPGEGGGCLEEDEPCTVKIDEEGVPGEYEGEFDYDPAETAADVLEVAGENPAADTSWISMLPIVPTGGCQSLTFDAWGNYSLVFPGVDGCAYIEQYWKPMLAWLLAVLTILYILHRFYEEI